MSNLVPRMLMPWNTLIEAFIANIPHRMELMKAGGGLFTRESAFREFHTLEIHGPRQCGKTEAALQFILNNRNVKFCIPKIYKGYYERRLGEMLFNQGYIEEHALMLEVAQPHCVDDHNLFAGVKVLIFDENHQSAWEDFIKLYMTRPEWFDPEFMVIRLF